jgi:hypothetical protein
MVDSLPNGGTVDATSATDVSIVLGSDASVIERLGAALGG